MMFERNAKLKSGKPSRARGLPPGHPSSLVDCVLALGESDCGRGWVAKLQPYENLPRRGALDNCCSGLDNSEPWP